MHILVYRVAGRLFFMDKVLVLGALEELGFEMTASLLEEGYEVSGIHLEIGNETKYNLRRMEIGRNANFEEVDLNEWLKQDDFTESSMFLFVNGFDENVKRVWMENRELKGKLETISNNPDYSIIFIYPFSEWEIRSKKQYAGNTMSFFVPLSYDRNEFPSIFKAILDVVDLQ